MPEASVPARRQAAAADSMLHFPAKCVHSAPDELDAGPGSAGPAAGKGGREARTAGTGEGRPGVPPTRRP